VPARLLRVVVVQPIVLIIAPQAALHALLIKRSINSVAIHAKPDLPNKLTQLRIKNSASLLAQHQAMIIVRPALSVLLMVKPTFVHNATPASLSMINANALQALIVPATPRPCTTIPIH
jgi:hypothetical protein